jgi:hypothetical protein
MGDLSLTDKNFADAGTELFIDDAPFNAVTNYMLWVDALLVLNKDIIGVIGVGGNGGTGVWGESQFGGGGQVQIGSGPGVYGKGVHGVQGRGAVDGVFGRGSGFAGVEGQAADKTKAIGVYGAATENSAVVGDNRFTKIKNTGGCVGFTRDGFGTVGVVKPKPQAPASSGNAGLLGIVEFDPNRKFDDPVTAVLANAAVGTGPKGAGPAFQGFAGIFNGPVAINGPLTVFGQYFKSAAVPHPDGSHRRLYCVEAPDSLFEDIGRGQLKNGSADVKLDRDFAALIHTGDYHVFLTAEGDCGALYVAQRNSAGFSVREHGGSATDVTFSYRIVAKRKDVKAPRLEKVTPPRSDVQAFDAPSPPATTEPVFPDRATGKKPRPAVKKRAGVKARKRAAKRR